MTKRVSIIAVGQLPPPVTGFAQITAKMIETISQSNDVELINTAPKVKKYGAIKHIFRARSVLKGCWRILRNVHSPRILYTGCEGDWGLIYTLLLVFVATTRGYAILLHHHSFSYIDRTFRLMQMIVKLGGDRTRHVFLCEEMQRRFVARYEVAQNTHIISNAAFVPPSRPLQPHPHDSATRLGLLSNLTREKGLHVFIETVRRAREAQLDVTGLLAGPIQKAEDRAYVAAAEKELGSRLRYLGPLYGEAKEQFYHDIDVFVFPTEYANEAQPTVLFEAQATGSLLVAFDRGCIANQIGECGVAVPKSEEFARQAISYLRKISSDPMQPIKSREAARENYRIRHESALIAAKNLVSLATEQFESRATS